MSWTRRPPKRRDPRTSHRYRALRAAWLPTAHPVCVLCGKGVDITLPPGLRDSPTVEHIVPIRTILATSSTWAEAVAMCCDTSLWALAHRRCQVTQGAKVGRELQRRAMTGRRRPSRAW